MKRFFRRIIPLLMLTAIFSCRNMQLAENEVPPPQKDEALIVFISGEVLLQRDGAERPAEVGERLRAGDILQSGRDSYCDIQMGSTAVVQMEQDTYLEISSLYSAGRGADIQLWLNRGAVACKVRTLTGREDFAVRTPALAAGVRGTQFVVRADSSRAAEVAVGSGRVQVMPQQDFSGLLEQAPTEYAPIIENVLTGFPVIEEGRQVRISAGDARMAEDVYIRLNDAIDGPKSKLSENLLEAERLVRELETFAADASAIDSDNQMLLKNLENVDFLSEEKTDAWPVAVEFHTYPGGTISVNGRFAGITDGGGLYPANEPLRIQVKMNGYYPFERTVEPSLSGGNSFSLQPDRIPGRTVTVRSEPENARILFNGILSGTGSAEYTLSGRQPLLIMVDAEGYNPRYELVSLDDDEPLDLLVRLRPTILKTISVSNNEITSLDSLDGQLSVLYGLQDGTQRLSLLDPDEGIKWTIRPQTIAADTSRPLLLGDSLFFAGFSELVSIDRNSGEIRFRRLLEPGERLIFGRKPAAGDQFLVYPTDSGFQILNPDTGRVLRGINVPGGTHSSPSSYQGDILILSTEGILRRYTSEGVLMAEIPTSADNPSGPAPLELNDLVYIGDSSGQVLCVDLKMKEELWSKTLFTALSVPIKDRPVIYRDSLWVYAMGYLMALDRFTGEIRYTLQGVYSAPVLLDGLLYASGSQGAVTVINPENGYLVGSLFVGEPLSSPPVALNDSIAVGTSTGNIVLLSPLMAVPEE